MTTEVVLDDNREVVLSNATVTASGFVTVTSYGGKEVILVVNVSGSVTGSSPTLQFTIQEVDPGDEVTSIGVAVTGAVISATGVQIITVPVSRSSFFKVSWTVTGSSPVFNAVYATMVNKGAGASVLYDNLGNSVFGTAGTPGTAVLTIQGVSGGQPSPVSGTVTVQQATAANLNAVVTQGPAAALSGYWTVRITDGTNTMPTGDVISRAIFHKLTDGTNTAAVTASSALKVDGSAVTQPVSGTVTSNQGTANSLANGWPVKITDGTNTAAVKAASTTAVAADPSLVVAVSPNTPAKIWDGTNTAAVKAASTAPVATDPALVVTESPNSPSLNDTTASGSLNALNTTASVALAGQNSVGFQLAAGTLIGTIVPEVSFDGGTTWVASFFDDPTSGNKTASIVFASNNTATARTIIGAGGASNARVRVSVFTSGTATCNIRASDINDPSVLYSGAPGSALPPLATYLGAQAPSGSLIGAVAGSEGSIGHAIMSNQFGVHSNSTITTSGSQLITKNFYGTQQVTLIVNVKASPTGTTPTITFTIQEVDPGDATTVLNTAVATQTINAIGVYQATLNNTVSGLFLVSWTVTGTTPSFTQVYTTVVSKATPVSQTVTTTASSSTPGNAVGYVSTSATTNVPVRATTYTEQSSNFTGSVVSSSTSDTSAGTGARTIKIYYVNSTGTTAGTESATLNGTTAVNLVTTTKCFIENITVVTVGSGGANVGTITLFTSTGGGGTNVASIGVGDNRTYLGLHYVVSGKTCNISGMTGFNSNSSNNTIFTIRAIAIPVANQVSVQVSDWVTGFANMQIVRLYDQLIKITGPARLQLYGAPQGTPTIKSQGSFDYYDQ